MIKIHPSSLGKIMTSAKSKKPEDLSVGALTHCYEKAKEFIYGYRPQISSKYLDKGVICEGDSISLYNSVFFTNHVKNEERRENQWLTGECDIEAIDRIIDVKTSWSAETFPAISSRIDSKLYEWQGRAYLMLWDAPLFELAYCLVSTPTDLIGYESEVLHYVDSIEPSLRITVKQFERDEEKENLIKIKCEAAQIQIQKYIDEITSYHSEL